MVSNVLISLLLPAAVRTPEWVLSAAAAASLPAPQGLGIVTRWVVVVPKVSSTRLRWEPDAREPKGGGGVGLVVFISRV